MNKNTNQELLDAVSLANDYLASASIKWEVGVLWCNGAIKGLTRTCTDNQLYCGVIMKGNDVPAMLRYVNVLCSFFNDTNDHIYTCNSK